MEPIRVPRPPAEAFNKNRRISDLIRAQVNHFKHIEQKMSSDQRRSIPQQGVTTEGEAARYIAAMTAALRAQSGWASSPGSRPVPGIRLVRPRVSTPPEPVNSFDIAAGADTKPPSTPPLKAAPVSPSKKKTSGPKSSRSAAEKAGNPAPEETK